MSNLKEKIGKQIRKYRKLRGLKQHELAELADLDPRSISRVEVGGNYPSFESLEKICVALQCEIADIFDYPKEDEIKNQIIENIKSLSADEIKILSKVFSIKSY